jgi:hypothetical protein
MFEPQRVWISRRGDPNHESWQKVPGVMTAEPELGESFQMFLENGQVVRTTPVTHVEHEGKEIVVDTRNSRYRLTPAS